MYAQITAVSNRNSPSLKVAFDPFAQAHPEDREFKDIIETFRLWLDGVYSQQYNHRIQSKFVFLSGYLFIIAKGSVLVMTLVSCTQPLGCL